MIYVPREELLVKTGSIYKLCVLASRRALEINAGAPKLVEIDSQKPIAIALEEIKQGKITYKEAPASGGTGGKK